MIYSYLPFAVCITCKTSRVMAVRGYELLVAHIEPLICELYWTVIAASGRPITSFVDPKTREQVLLLFLLSPFALHRNPSDPGVQKHVHAT